MTQRKELPELFQHHVMSSSETDAAVLSAKARDALSGLTDMYRDQLKQDIAAMRQFLNRAETASEGERFSLIRTDLFNKMHDLKGQGSTFGYPLLTELGAFACDYLRHKTQIEASDLAVVDRVLNDVSAVYETDLTEDGGSEGKKIRQHIKRGFNA